MPHQKFNYPSGPYFLLQYFRTSLMNGSYEPRLPFALPVVYGNAERLPGRNGRERIYCIFHFLTRLLLPSRAALTMSQSPAALMLRAGVSSVFTASAVFLEIFPRLAAERTPRSKYARPLFKFSCVFFFVSRGFDMCKCAVKRGVHNRFNIITCMIRGVPTIQQ